MALYTDLGGNYDFVELNVEYLNTFKMEIIWKNVYHDSRTQSQYDIIENAFFKIGNFLFYLSFS